MEKSNHEIDELLKDVPEALQPYVAQEQVNQSLIIYKGVYHLIFDQEEVEVDGEIYYSWKPENSIKFKGSCNEWFFPQAASQIRIEGVDISHQGLSYVTGSGSGDAPLKGIINSPFVIQHQNKGAVSTVSFELANFRDVVGLPIKTSTHLKAARIHFESDEWKVLLDKRDNYDEIKNELKDEGGYGLMYAGQLTYKKENCPMKVFRMLLVI